VTLAELLQLSCQFVFGLSGVVGTVGIQHLQRLCQQSIDFFAVRLKGSILPQLMEFTATEWKQVQSLGHQLKKVTKPNLGQGVLLGFQAPPVAHDMGHILAGQEAIVPVVHVVVCYAIW